MNPLTEPREPQTTEHERKEQVTRVDTKADSTDARTAATAVSKSTLFHPVQADRPPRSMPECVTRRAYEVYCGLWGEQEALMTGWCRGGFGLLELIALLYARSFPRDQWRARFDEAIEKEAERR